MTATTCRVCQAATDQAFLCRSCGREIEQAVAELAADHRDLTLVATRQARGPLGLGGAHYCERDDPGRAWRYSDSPKDEPWTFAPGAADQVWVLVNTVLTWARHIAESRKVELPKHDRITRRLGVDHNRMTWRHFAWPVTVETLCTWLVDNIESIRQDEAAAQIHEELTGLHAENERWILGRSGTEVFAGRCDAAQITFEQRPRFHVERNRMHVDPDGPLVPVAATCGAPLYGHSGEEDLRCQACGMKYRLADRLDARDRQIEDQLARAHQIAAALTSDDMPLSPTLLRKWIQRDADAEPSPEGPACVECAHRVCTLIRRRLILAQGTDEEGHPLYRFGDVRARLAQVQAQRGMKLSA